MKPSQLGSRFLLVLALPLASCCEDPLLTHQEALSKLEQERANLRRLLVQRNIVEKKFALTQRLAMTARPATGFVISPVSEHETRAGELDQQIAEQRPRVQAAEDVLAAFIAR